MTFMDDFMDDCQSWFKLFLHIVYRLTDRLTDWQTDGHWYPLSRYRDWKVTHNYNFGLTFCPISAKTSHCDLSIYNKKTYTNMTTPINQISKLLMNIYSWCGGCFLEGGWESGPVPFLQGSRRKIFIFLQNLQYLAMNWNKKSFKTIIRDPWIQGEDLYYCSYPLHY